MLLPFSRPTAIRRQAKSFERWGSAKRPLSLEDGIRRAGGRGKASAKGSGTGKPGTEADGGGLEPRPLHVAGGGPKKALRPACRRELVSQLRSSSRVSERRACSVLRLSHSCQRYQSVADRQEGLRLRLKDLSTTRVSYGYRRLHILLRRGGWRVNHKRVCHLYVEEGLGLRLRKPQVGAGR